jgi:hypothetical protein
MDFFHLLKKEKKIKKIKMHWRLGWSDLFFGRNFRTWNKKKALETSTKASIGNKWPLYIDIAIFKLNVIACHLKKESMIPKLFYFPL